MKSSQAETAFARFSSKLHPHYATEFRDRESDHLVILLSPKSKFTMYNIDFDASTLFLADQKKFYYLHNPGSQTELLHQFIVASGFKTVTMIGSSKGGVGALLWSAILSRWCKEADDAYKIVCLSFSPQTKLFPKSDVITFPSYHGVFKSSAKNAGRQRNLEKYGDIKPYIANSHAQTMLFYSEDHEVDRHEAEHLCDTDVKLVSLPLTFHGAITPYLIDRTDPNSIHSTVNKMFKNAEHDEDLASTLPQDKEILAAMLDKVSVPYITDLVQMFR